eukprot:GHVP01014116.1.p1 GENE.GHVP01014116.1~~GHVP01014116.1.p1  ORF type:complete len:395 (-),score=81.06 GHVP01014116.1:1068-2252(-)
MMGDHSVVDDLLQIYERNQEATIYVGNLDAKVDEEILWELFVQCGPLRNVHIPRDKVLRQHSNYGFVEFVLESDADYAMKIMSMIKLFHKSIKCNKASQDKRIMEIGANLFVGNLDTEVDERLLYDTFSAFGGVINSKIMRDPDSAEPRGFGFVSFDSFEAADACLASMSGQFLCNRPIHVSYAYKKDTKGERHGSAAERLMASNRPAEFGKSPMRMMDTPVPLANQHMSYSPVPGLFSQPIPQMPFGQPTPAVPGLPHFLPVLPRVPSSTPPSTNTQPPPPPRQMQQTEPPSELQTLHPPQLSTIQQVGPPPPPMPGLPGQPLQPGHPPQPGQPPQPPQPLQPGQPPQPGDFPQHNMMHNMMQPVVPQIEPSLLGTNQKVQMPDGGPPPPPPV